MSTRQLTKNREAMLDTIAWSEGTSTSRATKNDGYDVIVTGIDGKPEIFTDYRQHPFVNRPPKLINRSGLESTASGRYQILRRFWLAEAKAHNYLLFDPYWQDCYAIQQFKERGALSLIDFGQFHDALVALNGIWASLPGKQYVGQHQRSEEQLLQVYTSFGGTLAPGSKPISH